ncbi:MAG: hypothetical protein AAGH15_19610 [Myxococcota bacterium]
MRRVLGRIASIMVLSAWVGCGQAPVPVASPEPPVPGVRGPLLAHLPAGARFVGRVEPARLWALPAVRDVVAPLLRPEGIAAFQDRTGVPLLEVEEAVFARYGEDGFVVLARLPEGVPAPDVVRANAQRMAPVEIASDAPFMRRVGYLGEVRRELVALDARVLLVAGEAGVEVTELLTALRAGGAALGLRGSGRRLAEAWGDAPCVVVAPEPLPLDRSGGIGLVLARHEAAALRIDPAEAALRVRAAVVGELPSSAERNFRTWIQSVARSDLGRAFGLEDALPTYRAAVGERDAELSIELSTAGLAEGVRLLFLAELDEIFAD